MLLLARPESFRRVAIRLMVSNRSLGYYLFFWLNAPNLVRLELVRQCLDVSWASVLPNIRWPKRFRPLEARKPACFIAAVFGFEPRVARTAPSLAEEIGIAAEVSTGASVIALPGRLMTRELAGAWTPAIRCRRF